MRYLAAVLFAAFLVAAFLTSCSKSLADRCESFAEKACKDSPQGEMCELLAYGFCKHYKADPKVLEGALNPPADK